MPPQGQQWTWQGSHPLGNSKRESQFGNFPKGRCTLPVWHRRWACPFQEWKSKAPPFGTCKGTKVQSLKPKGPNVANQKNIKPVDPGMALQMLANQKWPKVDSPPFAPLGLESSSPFSARLAPATAAVHVEDQHRRLALAEAPLRAVLRTTRRRGQGISPRSVPVLVFGKGDPSNWIQGEPRGKQTF